jgi:hypothetical protein
MVGRFGVIWWVQLWMMEAGVVLGGFVGLNQVLALVVSQRCGFEENFTACQ